ncbi:hypothetical protein KR49_05865 [Synechococcus sp. KORDI-49]|nr:hypothetical protein KR49_05865 [Synechococcus sp. KORDI-49]
MHILASSQGTHLLQRFTALDRWPGDAYGPVNRIRCGGLQRPHIQQQQVIRP